MNRYIAILRGINVGGHRKIKMADLIKHLSDLGLQNITTYLQSGNVVFESTTAKALQLAQDITYKIKKEYDFDVPVLIKTATEIREAFENNPFKNKNVNFVYLTFLNKIPEPELVSKIRELSFLPDEFELKGCVVYLYCPNGYSNTKLSNSFFESKLKVTATTRNWKTTNKLIEFSR